MDTTPGVENVWLAYNLFIPHRRERVFMLSLCQTHRGVFGGRGDAEVTPCALWLSRLPVIFHQFMVNAIASCTTNFLI